MGCKRKDEKNRQKKKGEGRAAISSEKRAPIRALRARITGVNRRKNVSGGVSSDDVASLSETGGAEGLRKNKKLVRATF